MVMVTNFPSKKAWDSGSDNILEDFYKPALIHAKRYCRGQRQNNDLIPIGIMNDQFPINDLFT